LTHNQSDEFDIEPLEFDVFATKRFKLDCACNSVASEAYCSWIQNIVDDPQIGEVVRGDALASLHDYEVSRFILRYAVDLSASNIFMLTLRTNEEDNIDGGDRVRAAWKLFVEAVSVYAGLGK